MKYIEEYIFKALMYLSLFIVAGFVLSVLWSIFSKGVPVLTWEMVTSLPGSGFYVGKEGGFLNAIVGSVYIVTASTIIGLIVSIPVVFFLNVYLKAYDFEYFDSGDQPARFARRYVQGRYRKINQAKLNAYGQDNWSIFQWQTLSWGSPTSMVSTKLYNKSLEIQTVSKEKVYIKRAWFDAGLVDDPINFTKLGRDGKPYTPEIWRVEFSMKSKAEGWLVIEDQSGKKVKKKPILHKLSLFDSPDKLWQRFQDLAYHYFRFKISRYKEERNGVSGVALSTNASKDDWTLQRKDRCPDKYLFKWDKDHEFWQVKDVIDAAKPDNELTILKRHLIRYRNSHTDEKVREACSCLIDVLEKEDLRRYTPKQIFSEVEALRRALALRMKHPDVDIIETIAEIQELLFNDEMF